MDHAKVLKRAWEILRQYRVLWIFGFILVLTTTSPGGQSNYHFNRNDVPSEFNYQVPDSGSIQGTIESFVRTLIVGLRHINIGLIITIVAVLLLVGLALSVIAAIARYVSETSLIRMVDAYEETGEKLGFRQGWKLGWSREAWRLFLIDLVIFIPIFVGVIVLFLLAGAPLLMWLTGNKVTGAIGTVAAIGFLFLVIFLLVVILALLALLQRFFRRVCVLEEAGVKASLQQGFAIVKKNWKDVGLMWLITVGISIGWAIVMIPIALLLVGVGALLGGGVGLVTWGVTGLVLGDVGAWIAAAVVGLPIFILVFSVPLTFLNGLKEVYMSSTWTLTYRELKAMAQLEPVSLPEPDVPELA